ncbi:hypothetical protein LX36DRAFT_17406 [Colletotrichum falcatum]|nr:hypothetical protein LX36DRAFT_17406 [Colletotrichum falcatum]
MRHAPTHNSHTSSSTSSSRQITRPVLFTRSPRHLSLLGSHSTNQLSASRAKLPTLVQHRRFRPPRSASSPRRRPWWLTCILAVDSLSSATFCKQPFARSLPIATSQFHSRHQDTSSAPRSVLVQASFEARLAAPLPPATLWPIYPARAPVLRPRPASSLQA